MKSYEEMTDAVLQCARERKAAQRRRQKLVVSVFACVSCFVLLLFTAVKGRLLEDHNGDRSPRLSVFYITANAATQQEQMLKGEKIPYNAFIKVRDITNVDGWELLELQKADKEYASKMAGQNSEDLPGNPDWSITSRIKDNTMITTVFVGSFYLSVDDYKEVEDVYTTTTEIGWVARHIADYNDVSLRDGIGITWALSETGVDMIENDPQMKLSELTDTITVTVRFKDGSEETAVIDITVDNDGMIYGVFKGIDVKM